MPRRILQLLIGLPLYGVGAALTVDAGLGVDPWTVLAEGMSEHLPLSIGLATFLTSCTVLLLWIPLRERPGLGTISNAIVISVALFALMAYALWDYFGDTELLLTGSSTAELGQTTAQVADSLFLTYLVPFEVVSVLLLAALTGAIVLARRD